MTILFPLDVSHCAVATTSTGRAGAWVCCVMPGVCLYKSVTLHE